MPLGEVDRLDQPGDHSDQVKVDRKLHAQRGGHRSAPDEHVAHRSQQRVDAVDGGRLTREHRHQLAGLGGFP
jgi:hypothetical protein